MTAATNPTPSLHPTCNPAHRYARVQATAVDHDEVIAAYRGAIASTSDTT